MLPNFGLKFIINTFGYCQIAAFYRCIIHDEWLHVKVHITVVGIYLLFSSIYSFVSYNNLQHFYWFCLYFALKLFLVNVYIFFLNTHSSIIDESCLFCPICSLFSVISFTKICVHLFLHFYLFLLNIITFVDKILWLFKQIV